MKPSADSGAIVTDPQLGAVAKLSAFGCACVLSKKVGECRTWRKEVSLPNV